MKHIRLLLAVILAVGFSHPFPVRAATGERGLTILYGNDVHGETEPCG